MVEIVKRDATILTMGLVSLSRMCCVGCRILPSPSSTPSLVRIPAAMVGGSLTCSCGRAFTQHNALSNHQRHCQKLKKRLSGALTKFKDLLGSRKRRRVDADEDPVLAVQSTLGVGGSLGHLGLRTVSVRSISIIGCLLTLFLGFA